MLRAGKGSSHPERRSRVPVHYTGWTTDELADRTIPTAGLDERGRRLRNALKGVQRHHMVNRADRASGR